MGKDHSSVQRSSFCPQLKGSWLESEVKDCILFLQSNPLWYAY